MKKSKIFSILLAIVLLIAYCVGTVCISLSLEYPDINEIANTGSDSVADTSEDQDNNSGSSEADSSVTGVDMLDEQKASEYEADGTLPERQNYMKTLQMLNEPYYSTFTLNTADNLEVKDIANIIPSVNPANMPAVGEAKALVFLVEFPDIKHEPEVTREAAEEIFFGEDSLSSFYYESSYNKLTITGDVQDWYTAKHDRDYYVQNGIAALYREVLDAFDDQIDYSQYDADGNAYIDGLYLHFAGESSGWGSALWSYVTWLFEDNYDGVTVGPRACLLHKLDVETLRHETGHLLGLPDYYSYTIISLLGNYNWVGSDDIMFGGMGEHNAVSKMLLGWITSVRLISADGNYSLGDFSKTGDAAILYPFGGTEGDSFFILQKQKDQYGTPILKMFRINALTKQNTYDGGKSYVHSNMYGDVPFVELIANLQNGKSATPYDDTVSTHYYNDKTEANTFSGVTVSVPENGLSIGDSGSFNVTFEKGPSIIEPPVIHATATVNQITATLDFSVPFSINTQIIPYLIDQNGTRIATMSTKAIFSDNGYHIDKATCVLRVASYREWGFDGKNEITVGTDQDYLLQPGEQYTIVIPRGAFQTVMGDIDEIRIDITGDTTADQEAKYQPIISFNRCSEFITLSDGRAAYAYVDVNDTNRPLKLVLLSEDGTTQEYTLTEADMLGYVGICQLSDGAVAVSCSNRAQTTTLVYKFDLTAEAVVATLDVGEQISWSMLSSFTDGFFLHRNGVGNGNRIIKIDNALQNSTAVLPEFEDSGDFSNHAKIIVGEKILYIDRDFERESYKHRFSLYNADGELLARNAMIGYQNAVFIGAVENSDYQIVLAYYDRDQSVIQMLVFDEDMRLLEIVTPDFPSQPVWYLGKGDFKCVEDGYFLSYAYIRQYNPKGLVGMFNTENYQQGLLFDGDFNVKSAFDVAYAATAAEVGSAGNRFMVGDEYGYYMVNAELTVPPRPAVLSSDVYTVDNETHTVTGVPAGTTAENILKFLQSNAEDCRYEFRYTYAERNKAIKADEVISCNYELLVYDPNNVRAAVYTFPELPADPDSAFSVGGLHDYTATEEKLVTPDFVTSISNGSNNGSSNDLSKVTSLTTKATVSNPTLWYISDLLNLQELTLLEGCKEIGYGGFSFCHNLKKVVIPNTVKRIGQYAFYNCDSLEEVVIPTSVTRICDSAFAYSGDHDNLKITYLGTREQWEEIDFRRFDFDTDGEYGFYDWKAEFGDCLVFAGSGIAESNVPEFKITGISVNTDNSRVGFKVNKSLFERYGYVQPGLQVIFDSGIQYLTEYTVEGNYYVFTLPDIKSRQQGKTVYATLIAYYNGTLCVSDTLEHSLGDGVNFSISGKITSYGQDADTVNLRLLKGTEEVAQTTTADGTYQFTSVLPDIYTLEVSQSGHITRTYEVVIEGETTTLNVKLLLIGDTTGDGEIDIFDILEMLDYVNGDIILSGIYKQAGLIVNEEDIDIFDALAVLDHINGDASINP